MKKLTFLLFTVFLAFTACNQSTESSTTSDESTTAPAIDQTGEETATPNVNPAHGQPGHVHEEETNVNPPHGQPGHVHEAEEETVQEESVVVQGDVTINPAHGEPGHRCDLKVGDPLPN